MGEACYTSDYAIVKNTIKAYDAYMQKKLEEEK